MFVGFGSSRLTFFFVAQRLILEIGREVRKRTSPSFILSIKLNSVEFQDKGFQPEDAKRLCALLEENKFDFVELSGGTYEHLAFTHQRYTRSAPQ